LGAQRAISLLCDPFKILERLIYARVEPIINPLLTQEQVDLRHGRSTVDQIILLTQGIKDSLSEKKAGGVFVDLTAAYDQTRNEGGQRGHDSPGAESLWGRKITAEAPNHCGRCRKVPAMSQIPSSIQYICFRHISGSNMGALNLLFAPGAIYPHYASAYDTAWSHLQAAAIAT